MPRHPLENLLNAFIRNDPRAASERGQHARRHGVKRTNIERVTVTPVGGAAPQDLVQQEPSDAGSVFVTSLDGLSQPFDYNAVVQWILADCGLLTGIMCAAGLEPYYFRRLIYPDPADKSRVIVQVVWNGLVIRVHTTLLVSSAYNAGSPANPSSVVVELLEKVTGLVRTGASQYAGDNWGWSAYLGMKLLGLSAGTVAAGAQVNAAAIASALSAGKAVGLNTTSAPANPPAWWKKDHVVMADSVDLAKGTVTIRDPWHGGDLVTFPASDITPQLLNSIDAGAIANPPLLAAPVPPVTPNVSTGATVTYDRSRLQPFYIGGNGGFAPTLWMSPASSIVIPNTGSCSGTVTTDEPAAVVYVNGLPHTAVNGTASFTATGNVMITARGGGFNVSSVSLSAANVTLYTVTVTAPGGTAQTFTASKIVATLADGSPKTIPEAA